MWIIKHIKISKVVELGSNMAKVFSTYAILLAQAVIIFAVQNKMPTFAPAFNKQIIYLFN